MWVHLRQDCGSGLTLCFSPPKTLFLRPLPHSLSKILCILSIRSFKCGETKSLTFRGFNLVCFIWFSPFKLWALILLGWILGAIGILSLSWHCIRRCIVRIYPLLEGFLVCGPLWLILTSWLSQTFWFFMIRQLSSVVPMLYLGPGNPDPATFMIPLSTPSFPSLLWVLREKMDHRAL